MEFSNNPEEESNFLWMALVDAIGRKVQNLSMLHRVPNPESDEYQRLFGMDEFLDHRIESLSAKYSRVKQVLNNY